jgi:hypothetical protein
MPKRGLEGEDVDSAADGISGVGMPKLVGIEMNLCLAPPMPHPFSNRLTAQRSIVPIWGEDPIPGLPSPQGLE